MLVSEYGLDVQPYNETPVNDIRWEDCTLRQWLNEDFYESAFSSEEKEKILLSASAGFPKFNSRVVGGEYQYLERETEDKVFLLSYTEVRRYFPDPDGRGNGSNDYRRCYPTEYAKKSPALKTYQGTCGWWLCTGFYGYADRCRTMAASELGSLNAEEKCESMEYAVRPAIWITWQIQEAENETALMSNENVVSGYDRYYEKVDWTAAGLEYHPRPDGPLLCRAYARVTPPVADVKGKMNGYAALDIRHHRRYVVEKAAAGFPGYRPE